MYRAAEEQRDISRITTLISGESRFASLVKDNTKGRGIGVKSPPLNIFLKLFKKKSLFKKKKNVGLHGKKVRSVFIIKNVGLPGEKTDSRKCWTHWGKKLSKKPGFRYS